VLVNFYFTYVTPDTTSAQIQHKTVIHFLATGNTIPSYLTQKTTFTYTTYKTYNKSNHLADYKLKLFSYLKCILGRLLFAGVTDWSYSLYSLVALTIFWMNE